MHKEIIEKAYDLLSPCMVCPHQCGVDRLADEAIGDCLTGLLPKIAAVNLHFGEEPPISGYNGSGTIFFANCNMRCLYCQNYPISQYGEGREVSPEKLGEMMIKLQKQNAHNINLVTPSHIIPQIIKAFYFAKENGLNLPIVYNTSGYDRVETLKLLEGIIDIYMPDMRYGDSDIAKRLSGIEDYPKVNRAAVLEMYRQVGDLKTNNDGIAIKGLLIRHLILPNGYSNSKEIFRFIADNISKKTYISLMSQYFPAYKAVDDPQLNRHITKDEFQKSVKAFYDAGLSNGYIQTEPM